MGPDWIAARTLRGHNGTSYIDRVGHFFGSMGDRLRGRPARPLPGPTIQPMARTNSGLSGGLPNRRLVELDEHGQVPLQLITPRGVSTAPQTPSSVRGLSRPASRAGSGPVLVSVPAPTPSPTPTPTPAHAALPTSSTDPEQKELSKPHSEVAEFSSAAESHESPSSVVVDIPAVESKEVGACSDV